MLYIDQFSEEYPQVNTDYEIFDPHQRSNVKRFENKECICKSTRRPSMLTEAVIEGIQRCIDHIPTK